MKYFVLVPDGAADEPIEKLGGKTALEYADLSMADELASRGEMGTVLTVPSGIPVASDAANLAILGYDPGIYLTGRASLEAISMGIKMAEKDLAFRAGIVALLDPKTGRPADESTITPYEDLIMLDHTAGEISSKEAEALIAALQESLVEVENVNCNESKKYIKNKHFKGEGYIKFYPGIKYKAIMVLNEKELSGQMDLTGPHDIRGEKIGKYKKFDLLWEIQKEAYEIMRKNPVNLRRIEKGKNPGNAIWLWGQGKKPTLPEFAKITGKKASVISAVDLIKGIAICSGMESIYVEGATGTLNTNYKRKLEAAICAFEKGKDLVYMHLEGPDECGHQGDVEGKVKSLERIDGEILEPMIKWFRDNGHDFKVLIIPDHATPVERRVHTEGAVPYLIYDSQNEKTLNANRRFNEASAKNGIQIQNGYEILNYFLGNNFKESAKNEK